LTYILLNISGDVPYIVRSSYVMGVG
jgi:hypothetical protein